jgi:integrase
MTKPHSTASIPPNKPAKPTADFALFPLWNGKVGRWAKKIRGRLHYFGSWEDGADAALKLYLDQADALHSGRTPVDTKDALTVLRLTVKFLEAKRALHTTGELSVHSLNDYKETCKRLVKAFGKDRMVADLGPEDFAKLRAKMSKTWGVVRLGNEVNRVRSVFRFAMTDCRLGTPVVFGQTFKRPSAKTMRKHRKEHGPRMFQADEIRAMLDAAGQPLKAMILLGINCGFGNSDIGNVPVGALNLNGAWMDFARPKTGIDRKCPLWPETVQAIREWLAIRPKPAKAEHAELVFLTQRGGTWAKTGPDSPVSKEMRKLLDRLGINGGRNFYGLRHSFQNIGDEARDFVAVRSIMGHTMSGDIASNYRDRPSDERLRAVADFVREWLFTRPKKAGKPYPAPKPNPSNLRIYSA